MAQSWSGDLLPSLCKPALSYHDDSSCCAWVLAVSIDVSEPIEWALGKDRGCLAVNADSIWVSTVVPDKSLYAPSIMFHWHCFFLVFVCSVEFAGTHLMYIEY